MSPGGRCDTQRSSSSATTGAQTAIRLFSDETAPAVRPWWVASAALEMMLCMAAVATPPSRLAAMTAYIIQPSLARPNPR